MKNINPRSLSRASLACATALAISAQAQDTGSFQLEEIVVTAERRATNLSDTPIAVAAVSGDQLKQQGISDPLLLASSLPNTQLNINNFGLQITIRGVSSSDNSEKGDPSASFMLDGVYIARPYDQTASFLDVERIEVLRGPQGTLYGKNTTAGAVNVISARPKDEFEASVDFGLGSYDQVNTSAMVNLPLSDSTAIRAAVSYDSREAWGDRDAEFNEVDMTKAVDTLSARVSLLSDLTDDLSLFVKGEYSSLKGVGERPVSIANVYTTDANGNPVYMDIDSDDARNVGYPDFWAQESDNWIAGLHGELNWNLNDSSSITYVTSYRESQRAEHQNLFIFGSKIPITYDADFSQQSHELRYAFGGESPVSGQAGLYYFTEDSDIEFYWLGFPTFPELNTRYGFPNRTESSSTAAFAQLNWDITSALRLTAGVRHSTDEKSLQGSGQVSETDAPYSENVVGEPELLSLSDASTEVNKTTWRAGIDYDTELGLLYASISSGYKSGGFNDGCEFVEGGSDFCTLTAEQLYYDPEELVAYEAGFKFMFMDSTLSLNGSVFHYDYKNLQVNQLVGTPGISVTSNAAKAIVDGIELETIIQMSERSRLSANMNYLDARYDEYNIPVEGGSVDYSGKSLDRAPTYTANINYSYEMPVLEDFSLEFSIIEEINSGYTFLTAAVPVQYYQPSFTKTDLNLMFRPSSDEWYVQAYVRNIENKNVVTFATGSIIDQVYFQEPRVFGVRAGMNF